MESIQHVIQAIRPGAYMGSFDLKDVFYSIKINDSYLKYLKFESDGKIYGFSCMPNGYGEAMRIFAKVTKPPFLFLRAKGHNSVCFIDDSYLQGSTYTDCLNNIHDTIILLRKLGFTIHVGKSVLVPTQELTFLVFVINSRDMHITITEAKNCKIKNIILFTSYNNLSKIWHQKPEEMAALQPSTQLETNLSHQ